MFSYGYDGPGGKSFGSTGLTTAKYPSIGGGVVVTGGTLGSTGATVSYVGGGEGLAHGGACRSLGSLIRSCGWRSSQSLEQHI